MYRLHGIADLDYGKIFQTLKKLQPTYRSEWGVDYWNNDRDDKEQSIKTQYSEQSASYYQYVDTAIDQLLPIDIVKKFSLDLNKTEVKILRYPPGSFTPPHIDRFNSLKTKYNLTNTENIIRIWISLQKPTFGHALFFENDVIYNVPQGTMLTWNHSARHSACNAGIEDRYIMTITSVVKD